MKMRRTWLAAFALLVFAVPAFADYQQAFREGVRAFEKKQWANAAANMREAIKLKPRSNERINISGGWNEQYNPSSFLAAAMASLGDCEEAHSALRASGLTANDKNYKTTVAQCPGYVGGPTPEELRAQKEKEQKDQAAKEQSAREQAAREQAAKEHTAREQAAREQTAREQAAKEQSAREQAAREQTAREQAAREQTAREQQAARDQTAREQAAREQTAKEQTAREQTAKEQAAREQAAREQTAREGVARVVEAKRALNARITEAKIYVTSSLGDPAARSALSTAVSSASKNLTKSTQAELDGASAALTRAIGTFRTAATSAAGNDSSTRLRLAIQSYLRGQYQETTAILANAEMPDGVLKAQAALFRAAAQYASAALAGDKGVDASAKIASDLTIYRRLQPGGNPDPRVFSPAFISFVKQAAR